MNRRLCNISSDNNKFHASTACYQDALKKAGYNHILKYDSNEQPIEQISRKRNRKIIWYNPPFCKTVSTNIGKKFLQLIDKNFPKNSILYKIFNRNTIKISYSCMDNMAKIINSHNKSVIRGAEKPTKLCNCRKPNECPLAGKCLSECVVYKATVSTGNKSKFYIGLCETDFKTRWRNHNTSFKYVNKRKQTALSNHIWKLKDSGIDKPTIKWSILKKTSAYSNISKRCQLCLWEKYFIITSNKSSCLNSRSELISKCRHANKYLLKNS